MSESLYYERCRCPLPEGVLWAEDCPNGHVQCDERCEALLQPVTLEETQAALEHWKTHDFMYGCSHGC